MLLKNEKISGSTIYFVFCSYFNLFFISASDFDLGQKIGGTAVRRAGIRGAMVDESYSYFKGWQNSQLEIQKMVEKSPESKAW
ncbi:MAG: hypothetical protein JHC32_08985 [Candidatus Aminicenantes bacterium]|nr:hypothetical protein [Candidatus Aminicenantes bacterium]